MRVDRATASLLALPNCLVVPSGFSRFSVYNLFEGCMSYQVLARKWRPQVFEDVVGQGHITRTLQNAITTNRLAHAFLFSGPRGVGKTTTARILAKALNCSEGPTPVPCGKCNSCLETTAGNAVDVIEIDGASNRGIEHIRELREAVKYAPVAGKYKVYVIDEVHMLTNEAFNALLKTLEEPPPHVIFIFATTEPQKIPATIHSRCQRYGFKRISLSEITGRLRLIADSEKIVISDQGLSMIARASEGSMRDSQSLLDQAVSYSGMEIKDEDLQTTLGAIAQSALLKFTASLLQRDAAALLNQVDVLMEQGHDMRQFLSGVVEHVRNLMVVMIAKEPGQSIELSTDDIDAIKQQASGTDMDRLILLFDSLSKTLDDMRWSPHQRFTIEIGLVKACSLSPLKPLTDVLAQMKELEARIASSPGNRSSAPIIPKSSIVREQRAEFISPPSTSASPGPPANAPEGHVALWSEVMNSIKTRKPGLASFLEGSRIVELSPAEMVINVKAGFQVEQVEKQENREILEQATEGILKRKIRVKVLPMALSHSVVPGTSGTAKNNAKNIKSPEPDPLVQDVLKVFDGHIVETDTPED
jgi:DNA polymerase III subunit gamma/tau